MEIKNTTTAKKYQINFKNQTMIGILTLLAFLLFFSLYKHDVIYPTIGMKIGAFCLGMSCIVLIVRYLIILRMYNKLDIKQSRLVSYISLHSFINDEGVLTLKEKHTERVIRMRNNINHYKWLINRTGNTGYLIAIILGLMDVILTLIDLFTLDGYFQ